MSDSLFYWTFYANSGDQYSGYTWDDSVDHYPGQYMNSSYGQGYYYVSNEYEYGYDLSSFYGSLYNEGTTYVYSYYDSATGTSYTPYYYGLGYASATSGIGSEYDYVYRSGSYDDFGYGGYYQAGDYLASSNDSLFYWTFYANSGDQYSGYTWDDSVDFFAGQYINSIYGQGYYYVSNEYEYGYDLSSYSGSSYNEGTTHVYAYYDSATGAVYTPYYYSLGYASTTSGIGSEYDYVYKSGIYNDFGVGGYYQA